MHRAVRWRPPRVAVGSRAGAEGHRGWLGMCRTCERHSRTHRSTVKVNLSFSDLFCGVAVTDREIFCTTWGTAALIPVGCVFGAGRTGQGGTGGTRSRRAAPLTLSNGFDPDRKDPPPTTPPRSHPFRPLCGRPAPPNHAAPRNAAGTPAGAIRPRTALYARPPLPPRMSAPEVRNAAPAGATPLVRGRRSFHSGVGVHEAAHSVRWVRRGLTCRWSRALDGCLSCGRTRRTPRTVLLKPGSWRACPRAPLGTACTGGSARLGSAPGRSRTPHTGYGGPQEWNAGREPPTPTTRSVSPSAPGSPSSRTPSSKLLWPSPPPKSPAPTPTRRPPRGCKSGGRTGHRRPRAGRPPRSAGSASPTTSPPTTCAPPSTTSPPKTAHAMEALPWAVAGGGSRETALRRCVRKMLHPEQADPAGSDDPWCPAAYAKSPHGKGATTGPDQEIQRSIASPSRAAAHRYFARSAQWAATQSASSPRSQTICG